MVHVSRRARGCSSRSPLRSPLALSPVAALRRVCGLRAFAGLRDCGGEAGCVAAAAAGTCPRLAAGAGRAVACRGRVFFGVACRRADAFCVFFSLSRASRSSIDGVPGALDIRPLDGRVGGLPLAQERLRLLYRGRLSNKKTNFYRATASHAVTELAASEEGSDYCSPWRVGSRAPPARPHHHLRDVRCRLLRRCQPVLGRALHEHYRRAIATKFSSP
eukprot:COSAG06_NODE_22833_length_711_cov_1.101307_2_plen_218_part_00